MGKKELEQGVDDIDIRGAIEDAFDGVMGKEEEDGETGGSGELEEEREVLGESGDVEDETDLPGESAGDETELGGEEEESGVDEDDGAVGDDDGLQEEDEEDQEEEDEGREEGEELELDAGEIEPPDFWPDEVKSEFSKMPPKSQEFYVNSFKGMQADYTQKMQGIAEVHKAIDPVREELASTGVSEGEMIRRFVAVHKRLEKDPAAAIEWVANLYGVDINQPASAGDDASTTVDPRVDKIEEKLGRREQEEIIRHAHAVNAEVERLKAEGKMPLYAEAEELMIGVVQRKQALGEAVPPVMEIYESVVWGDPALREKHLAHSDVERRKRKIVDKKKNVAKSKRAAGKRKPSKAPTAGEKRKTVTIRDELSTRLDEAMRGNR